MCAGTYKSSNLQNFPGSASVSGALITLHPGGLREQHWHSPNEWATVLNGTCRWAGPAAVLAMARCSCLADLYGELASGHLLPHQ